MEPTDFGFRLMTLRRISDQSTHVRVTNLMFPNAFVIPMSREMTITQWHVPVDDEKHYWYAIFTSFGAAVDKDEMRRQRLALYQLPDYVPNRNKSNDYGFDAHEQEHATFTGMGADINVHDQWACESMGAIQDRTSRASRHLRQGDRRLSPAAAAGDRAGRTRASGRSWCSTKRRPPRITGPPAIDGIGPDRRLAGLLAEDRSEQAPGGELGQWR